MPTIDLPAPGEAPNWGAKLNIAIDAVNAGVDTALGSLVSYVQAAKVPDLLVVGAVTGDPMTSAAVVWPDGKPGVLTITARHSSGAVNAYSITHVDGATTTTYTQPAITRATSGAVTNVPQIVVS